MSAPDFTWWGHGDIPDGYEARYYWHGSAACSIPGCCEPSFMLGAQPPEQAAIEAAVQRDERDIRGAAMRAALAVGSEREARTAATLLRLAFLALALVASGCGASALRAHASAAAVLTIAHEGAREVLVATVDAQAAECEARPEPERAPCAETLRAVAEPATVAVDGVRAGLTVYREAVTVAAAAEAGEDVLSALAVALARIVREWDTVSAALSRLGVVVPPLPPIVRGLLDALAGPQ